MYVIVFFVIDTVVSQENVKWSGNITPLLRTKRKECLTPNEGR